MINVRVYSQLIVIALIALALRYFLNVAPIQYLLWVAITKLLFIEQSNIKKDAA